MMNIRIKQRDITDCGAACLASVAAWHRLSVPVSRIRQYAGTDRKGTNVFGLVEAATKIGFIAKGVKGEWESLFKIPKPAIAHIIVKEVLTHYVVLLGTSGSYIEIMDPVDGRIHKVKHDEFRKGWTGVLVLLVPGEKFRITRKGVPLTTRLWQLIKPNRGILLQALTGALLFSVLGLATSLYVGRLVDHVIPGGNRNLLNLLGIAMILIILFRSLLSLFQSFFVLKTGQRIDASLILGYYQHLLHLPQAFFDNMRTGEIISRIGDAVKIRVFINDVAINLILNIFILAVSFILMFTFFPRLALVVLLVIPLYYLIYFISDHLNKKTQRKVMERGADLEAQFVESLNAAGTIKRFGLEDYSAFKTEVKFTSLLETLYTSGLNNIFSSVSTGLLSQLATIVILWTGAHYVLSSDISTGQLLSFYAIAGYFTGPVVSIINFNRTLQDARIAADRLFEIFDLDTDELPERMEFTRDMAGDICFDKITFRYASKALIFNSLSLTIKEGEITAITGESGSGKSTLVSLIQNLYPLSGGCIKIGGYDITHLTNRSLRTMISVVPQKIDLFSGNIIENIAPGEIKPDAEKVMALCKKLGMTEFIESLPGGFSSSVGEDGAKLSGGQKQRIAIARALYADPEIIILDEATSSLDSRSEMFLKELLLMLKREGKTVIIVTHRMTTISVADRIVVLDRGNVVQDGTLGDLLDREGHFRDLFVTRDTDILCN
ncbi:MAG: peptidase domain-containing ABC transporter [Bacteroidales bacterium]|jgi:ATP-binding cassette subfamily B protein|nr:peptidase domain-containing ABC transporter [Bacteroidales bacterium]